MLEWLQAKRSEGCTTEAMEGAAENGFLSVIEWLHTNRSEGCTKKAMEMAKENGFGYALEWLLKQHSTGTGLIEGRRVSTRLLRQPGGVNFL